MTYRDHFPKGWLFVIAAVMIIAYACNDVTNTEINSNKKESFTKIAPGKGQLNVRLTDAPAQYDAVYIDVQKVKVHFDKAFEDSSGSDSTMQKPGWITLSDSAMKVNLLDLTNGVDTLLAQANLEPGHYSHLRLILGNDNEVVVNGKSNYLKVPSGQHSGYKVKIQADIEAGKTYTVLIDFDASRSIHKAGRSGKYILKPVLRAVHLEEQTIGSISGVVNPPAARPNVMAIMNIDTTSTVADTTNGTFKLVGLEAGTYDVAIVPTNDSFKDTTLSGIEVTAGMETKLDTVQIDSL